MTTTDTARLSWIKERIEFLIEKVFDKPNCNLSYKSEMIILDAERTQIYLSNKNAIKV